jgi:hypothetical protein
MILSFRGALMSILPRELYDNYIPFILESLQDDAFGVLVEFEKN